MAKQTTAEWCKDFDFAREQAHKENARARQATIRARLARMRATRANSPTAAATGTFNGYAVGLGDLLTND